jgi:hypothetical protein
MSIILNVVCNVQHKSDKACVFRGMQGIVGGVDLMIVDIPKGLPVSMVSFPPTFVLEWNTMVKNFLPVVFDFGKSLVHDIGVLLFRYKNNL